MTSPFVQFFWFNLDQGEQSYGGGGGAESAPQVENVLNRPGEIGLMKVYEWIAFGHALSLTGKTKNKSVGLFSASTWEQANFLWITVSPNIFRKILDTTWQMC